MNTNPAYSQVNEFASDFPTKEEYASSNPMVTSYAPTVTAPPPLPAVSYNPQYSNVVTVNRPIRVKGRWTDGICDWQRNLWPSCFCVCCLFDGCWLLAQIAEKTQYAKFNTIVNWCTGMWLFCYIMQAIFPNTGITTWIPLIFLSVLNILLRFHVMRRDNIPGAGSLPECCMAFWCYPCSVAQMARHVYGYTKVFDGDSDAYRPDSYAPVEQV